VQLDLFLDSHEVVLANEAVAALLARDTPRAVAKVGQLEDEGSDHPALPALKVLANALSGWEAPAPDTALIARRVAWLQQEVTPAATAVLGGSAHAFLLPLLHELAETARALPYDSRYPDAHRGRLCLLVGDDDGTEEAVLDIPNWIGNPDALRWLSLVRYRRGGLDAARGTVFQLAWRAPAALPPLLAELDDALLLREWHAFEAACAWDSVPEEELAGWFPAWYLTEHPGAVGELRDVVVPDTPAAEAVRLLLHLLELEKQADVRALPAQRARLRALNSELFSLYMARRAVRHR
jgi:hypothetical protein